MSTRWVFPRLEVQATPVAKKPQDRASGHVRPQMPPTRPVPKAKPERTGFALLHESTSEDEDDDAPMPRRCRTPNGWPREVCGERRGRFAGAHVVAADGSFLRDSDKAVGSFAAPPSIWSHGGQQKKTRRGGEKYQKAKGSKGSKDGGDDTRSIPDTKCEYSD
eukprot:g17232.t1